MYADEISIWIKTDSPGHIQKQLQETLNKTQEADETIGLTCSTKKKNGITHGHQQMMAATPIQLTLQGAANPTPPTLKILRQHFQKDGGGHTTINGILKQG
ncbi:hypothetical protein HPB48_007827 [Haemaphysalis longicornis]|uniref:Uncharacterized protein n=1 Tax=Haemaphysalis longicornis TaxID=44386 RepID=A0A9J6GUZ6_HAELO|nr:hypothetical protein HPB48_007827 [Haemaphysalis longicornis]